MAPAVMAPDSKAILLKSAPVKIGLLGVPGRAFQDIGLRCFHGQGQAGKDVGDQVDPQQLRRGQGRAQPHGQGREGQHDFTQIGGQEKMHRLPDIDDRWCGHPGWR